jgi:hypothetical protein
MLKRILRGIYRYGLGRISFYTGSVGTYPSTPTKNHVCLISIWIHRCRNSEHGGLDLEELCKILREEGRYSDLFHPSQLDFAETLKQAKVDEVTAKIHDNSSSILPCIGKPVQVRTKPGVRMIWNIFALIPTCNRIVSV